MTAKGDIYLALNNPKFWDLANHPPKVTLVFEPSEKLDSDQGVSR